VFVRIAFAYHVHVPIHSRNVARRDDTGRERPSWHDAAEAKKEGVNDMGILAWLLVGLIGGVIAKMLVPGDDPGGGGILGIVVTILIGIAGALLGGFLAVAMGIGNGVDDFDIGTIFLSIVGAVLILVAYKAIVRNTAHA
jgi:uncharacterized membrane protein YeaQ/YmgE (transglycosylase-associated protein family)